MGDHRHLERGIDAYPELSEIQLRAAYYKAYPGEIGERLAREAYWTPERITEELPLTRRLW